MKHTLRFYIILIALTAVVGVAAYFALRHVFSDSGITSGKDERVELTPAVLDSIRSIGQWELASVELSTDVDTVRKRWLGIVKDEVKRRYTGKMSVGINLQALSDSCYVIDMDTITLTLPDVCLLDTNFIDESRTRTIIADNEEFEQDAAVKKRMLQIARRRLAGQATAPKTVEDCRQRATREIQDRFAAIGYSKVNVRFGK